MRFEETVNKALNAMAEEDFAQFNALLKTMNEEQKTFFEGFVEGYTTALRQISMAENDSQACITDISR